MAHLQKQMQDEMARFEAEISSKGTVQSTGMPGNSTFQKPLVKTLPKPPAPPANLAAIIAPSSTLFLPPQLQRAGVKPPSAPSVAPTYTPSGSSVVAAAPTAVISNKPVLYIPEKETKANPVVKSAPPAKKLKTETKTTAKNTSQSTSGTAILKAPSSTVGSAAVKPGQDPKVVKQKKPKKFVRAAGGQVWQDDSLLDWDPSDFRIFCGDLGNDVTDEVLARVFGRFPSFQKAKVIRDKRTNKTKGFGFVSFKDPQDFTRAMKELNGKYVGSRPIKLRKSNWKNRNIEEVRKRQKEKDGLLGKRR